MPPHRLVNQHRVGALKLLHDKGHHVGRVVVEVFTVSSEEEITALFCDINKVSSLVCACGCRVECSVLFAFAT
jgi:hypothetical protein